MKLFSERVLKEIYLITGDGKEHISCHLTEKFIKPCVLEWNSYFEQESVKVED
jgi:hypothetical protein